MKPLHRTLLSSIGVGLYLHASPGFAEWIQTLGQSERCTNLGGACVAREADLAASYYNPAAIAGLEKTLWGFNGKIVDTRDLDLKDSAGNQEIPKTNTQSDVVLSPSGAYYRPASDRLAWGVSLGSPFAISGDWGNDEGIHRYNMSEQALFLLDITPTLAYKVNERLSLGAGLNIVAFKHLRLETLIPDSFGAALPPELGGSGIIIPTTPTSPVIGSLTFNTDEDISIGLAPDDMAAVFDEYAITLGAQYAFSDTVTLGATYRSKTDSTWEGELVMDMTPSGGGIQTSDFEIDFDMPGHLQLGAAFELVPATLILSLDAQRTFWSDADGIGSTARFQLNNPLLGFVDSVEVDYEGEDTWTLRGGLEYRLNTNWTLMAGYAWDEAIFDDNRVDILTYDFNRHILSAGAAWTSDEGWRITGGFQAVVYEGRKIDLGESQNLGGVSLPNLTGPTSLGFVPNRDEFEFGGYIWTLGLGIEKVF